MSEPRTHRSELSIPSDHPSLPGHFPGRPIVPGVVLLDSVLAVAQRWLQAPVSVRSLPQSKFVAPLLPAERVEVSLVLEGDHLRFEIVRAATTIASGTLRIDVRPAS